MAEQASTSLKDLVDRVLEAEKQEQIAQRARDLVTSMNEAAGVASQRAAEAWRDSAALRDETSKAVARVGREASRWGTRTWRRNLAPAIRELMGRRALTLGAAGAAAPAVGQIFGSARGRRRGVEERERRHWGTFFLGLVLGAAAGVVAALLTAPKAGRQIRDDLAVGAREAAGKAREAAVQARDAAMQARDAAVGAAANAGDWMPIFQRGSLEEGTLEPIAEETPEAPAPKNSKPKTQPEPKPAD